MLRFCYLLLIFVVPDGSEQRLVFVTAPVHLVVLLNHQILIVSIQDPVIVAEHECSATLDFLFIPHLDLGLTGPLRHLGS